ncbi:MAG: hypothetical protein CMJ18_01805 [Phycisphaeraceae bacterium]|nr:hypothetical protein [Phycisphaeraceae bacterium]
MVDLTRTVRFFLSLEDHDPPPRHNGFSAWPPPRGLDRFLQLHLCCSGTIDGTTGYSADIKQLDRAVADHAVSYLRRTIRDGDGGAATGALMRGLFETLARTIDESLRQLRMDLSPFLSLTIKSHDMSHVFIAQQFEFAAAHRLHVPDLSDDENHKVFGKCSNPSGHGHNYRLEVTVRAPIRDDGCTIGIEVIDETVDRHVIEHFDHKHLNLDLPEFADLNPSVENIARVIFDRLEPHIEALDVELDQVSVWETAKTMCTYRRAQETAAAGA